MNVVIWVQYDTIATQDKAKGKSLLGTAFAALDKPKGSVNIVGVVESVPMPINKLNTIDKRELVNLNFDLVLVTGHDVDLAPILAEAAALGLDTDKFVLDRTVLIPGFTLEKYKALRHSDLSILSMGWWAGLAYHALGLPELSPTIGMYTYEESFINFLPEARWHIKKDLHFERTEYNHDLGINYPIFWNDGTQWFMNGYTSDADAMELWYERKNKINWSNVLFWSVSTACPTPRKLASFRSRRSLSRASTSILLTAAEIFCRRRKELPRAQSPPTTFGICCSTERKPRSNKFFGRTRRAPCIKSLKSLTSA